MDFSKLNVFREILDSLINSKKSLVIIIIGPRGKDPPKFNSVGQYWGVYKYELAKDHVLKWLELLLHKKAFYEEQPIPILEANEHILRGRIITLVRVLWQHHGTTETT